MGEEQDPQRLKRIAASSYDYEGDPRWAEYWSNILIPPHMASRSDVVDHFKRKFYQRFIDPELVVEAMASTSSSQSAKTSERPSAQTTESSRASERHSSQSSARNVRPQNPGSSGGTTGTAASTGRNANSLRLDQRSIHFSLNAWVLVVAVLGMLPVVPRNLSNKAYRLSLLGTACSSVYSLYTLYGKPRAWNLPAIQAWFQTLIGAKDFVHLIYCVTLVTSQLHFKFALIPVFCWSLELVAKFLRRNFARSSLYRKYLEEPCVWVEANGTTLTILSSNAEIGLGFLLILSLFSWQRNIIQTFIYWQLLKLMYQVPATSGYHQSVWARIGRTVNPYIYRYAPFLNSPISAVQRWWFR
ncbi:uncharacterized protein LOC121971759 [Zingiber officinale]|uniref:uncharacterized protein LOC121971759 n=1 Tax=Zingiber officinale TaxID=94328 RepID=UPI001C4BEC1C|nr:uncharacterized protein LOC121971759 [Zingiber officinale]